MEQITINAGGVPEHFNEPWHRAIADGAFRARNINLQWNTYPGGTGQMTAALRNNECDICVLLTEGIITDILNGNPSKIISGYIKSPLIWGIHSAPVHQDRPDSVYLREKFAISRKGSGSHLMPIVHGLIEGMKPKDSQFIVVNDLDGAIDSLHHDETQVFYWEKYTTKPYVTRGELIRIDEFITPWPCFVIAAREEVISKYPDKLDTILHIIHQYCADFMDLEDVPKVVADKYGLSLADAAHWFHVTEWAVNSWVSDKMLRNVLYMLQEAKICSPDANTANLIWKRNRAE